MHEHKEQLMKYFSLVLKKRSNENAEKGTDKKILKYLSRKDLIDVVNYRYDGKFPTNINLVEMENEGLLSLIQDELYIVAYVVQQWCGDIDEREKKKEEKPNSSHTSPKKTETSSSKTQKDGK